MQISSNYTTSNLYTQKNTQTPSTQNIAQTQSVNAPNPASEKPWEEMTSAEQAVADPYRSLAKIAALDERGNAILNQLLDAQGLTEEQKQDVKISIILAASVTMTDDGRITSTNQYDISKNGVLETLDKLIHNTEMSVQAHTLGYERHLLTLRIAKEFQELYQNDYKPLDIKG